jgi:hypothetical protein
MGRLGWSLGSGALAVAVVACSPDTQTDGVEGAAGSGSVGGGSNEGAGGSPSGGTSSQSSSLAHIVRAGVVMGSCLQDDGINRNLSYVYDRPILTGAWSRFGEPVDCLATTGGGCQAVAECLGYVVEPYDGTCEPCVGDVASVCANGYRLQLDCARLGLQCDPVAWCVEEAPATACDENTFARVCTADGRPRYCNDEVVTTGPVCTDVGLACEDGWCVGTGEACQGTDTEYEGGIHFEGTGCEGQSLIACVEGRTQRRDCKTVHPDFSCQSFGGEFFCGLASECVPGNIPPGTRGTAEQCEGTEVVFCNAGRIERVDCTELGFTGCNLDTDFGCTPGILG